VLIKRKLYSIESGGPSNKGSRIKQIAIGAGSGALLGGIGGMTTGLLFSKNPKTVAIATAVPALILGLVGGYAVGRNITSKSKETMNDFISLFRQGLFGDLCGATEDDIFKENDVEYVNLMTANRILFDSYVSIDKDPNKCPISFGIKDGVTAVNLDLNKIPTRDRNLILFDFNKILDDKSRWSNTYVSEQVSDGVYVVTINDPHYLIFNELFSVSVNSHVPVNLLTTEKVQDYIRKLK
jgi:hypothetical protein